MNRNDFIHMIGETGTVNRQMIGDLYELIDIFPYFQTAHLLLLKGLQNNADVKFEKQLQRSAIHIADRKVLYFLLKTKTAADESSDKVAQPGIPSESIVSDTLQTVIESAKNSDYLIDEIEKISEEAKLKEQSDSGPDIAHHSILISAESDDEESSGVLILRDEEPVIPEDQIFYMDPGFSLPENGDLLELDLTDNKTIIPDEVEFVIEGSIPENKTSERQLQSELIDKFIIANPRIEPVRDKTSLTSVDKSKPFIEEEGSFVTETLAKIYVNQEYYSKAIDIYEKLSLKFPEKSSYFASQIEKINERLKK
jgi:hypothetical protein